MVAYHFQFPRIRESNPPSPILSNQINLHRRNNKYCKYFLFNKILFLAKYYKSVNKTFQFYDFEVSFVIQ